MYYILLAAHMAPSGAPPPPPTAVLLRPLRAATLRAAPLPPFLADASSHLAVLGVLGIARSQEDP